MMFLWNLKETLERVIYTPVLKMVKEKKSWYFLPFTILTRKSMLRIIDIEGYNTEILTGILCHVTHRQFLWIIRCIVPKRRGKWDELAETRLMELIYTLSLAESCYLIDRLKDFNIESKLEILEYIMNGGNDDV